MSVVQVVQSTQQEGRDRAWRREGRLPEVLNVLQALCNPAFAGARLLAGWEGLDRTVTSVTVAEVPDSANWLVGGEVILTTGYFLHRNAHEFEEWFSGFARNGAAAVAIKPQRFIGQVPAQIVEVADRLGLPLVALPYTVTWPMVIRPLTEAIIFSDTYREDDHVGQLVHLLKARSGFTTVAQTLSRLIGHPVIIEDGGGRLVGLGLECGGNAHSQVIQARLQSPEPHLQQHPILWLEEGSERPWVQRTVTLAGHTVKERVYPLVSGANLRGYLTVLIGDESGQEHDRTLQLWASGVAMAFDRLAAYRDRPVDASRQKVLQALLNAGESEPDPDMERLFELYGAVVTLDTEGAVDLSGDHLAVREAEGRPGLEAVSQLVVELESWVRSFDAHGMVTPFEAGVMLLLHPPSEKVGVEFLRTRVAELPQRVRGICGPVAVQIGVGEPGRGSEHYRRSLKDALQALAVAKTQSGPERIWFYRDLGIYRLLFRPEQVKEVLSVTQDLLAPLLRVDKERGANLITTLEAFFAEDGDWGRAAQRLYLHPNTLRYRLRQVERLTGLDPRRLEDLLQLFLSVKVHRLHAGGGRPTAVPGNDHP